MTTPQTKELSPVAQKQALVNNTIALAIKRSAAALELRGVSPARQEKIFRAALMHNPDVVTADQESLLEALRKCCSVGIVPDGNQGVCFINKKGEATVYFMAHGLRKMVREYADGIVKSGVVYDTDTDFNLDLVTGEGGNPQTLKTLQARNENKEPKLVGAWCILTIDGVKYPELYSLVDIEATRKLSPQGHKEGGIWDIHYAKMAEKSVVKRCIMKNQSIVLERIENQEVAEQIRKDLEAEDATENMTVVEGVATSADNAGEQGEVIDVSDGAIIEEAKQSEPAQQDVQGDGAPPPSQADMLDQAETPQQGDGFIPEQGASMQRPPEQQTQQQQTQGTGKTDL